MTSLREKNEGILILIEEVINDIIVFLILFIELMNGQNKKRRLIHAPARYSMIKKIPDQESHLERLVHLTDSDCINKLRMDRNAFGRLCCLLRTMGGLSDAKFVSVEEQVAMFLSVLAHHTKNSVVKFGFRRSGQTVSHYVHLVLRSVLQVHTSLLSKPTPVPNDCTNPRWKWFKGCLGALDGTYVNVRVQKTDKGRYRTRKGQISTNVLAVCDLDLKFIYVLPGWEGSASDARVLRDSVNRVHGLKVPVGNYYLCDNGYANSSGFLAPFRGVRYHLDEWGPAAARPINAHEHINMRHTRARNIIERAFGIMKMRWAVFSSAMYYPIKVQIRLIMACFLLHNYIRNEMPVDPDEERYDAMLAENEDNEGNEEHGEFVESTESSPQWTGWRDDLAQTMWADFNNGV